MSVLDNRGQSIKLPEGVCVRLYEHDCAWKHKGLTLDVLPDSKWASRFGTAGMGGVSAVRRIECPIQPPLVSLFSDKRYMGKLTNS